MSRNFLEAKVVNPLYEIVTDDGNKYICKCMDVSLMELKAQKNNPDMVTIEFAYYISSSGFSRHYSISSHGLLDFDKAKQLHLDHFLFYLSTKRKRDIFSRRFTKHRKGCHLCFFVDCIHTYKILNEVNGNE